MNSVLECRLSFPLRVAIGALLCVALTACGFHLRGQEALPFDSLYVTPSNSEFADLLKRSVRFESHTKIADDAKHAQATLTILDARRERIILALSSAGRVQELTLAYQVSFAVVDSKGKQYLPRNTIVLRRDLTYNDTDVLAKQQEEDLLYKDMEKDAVEQVMRRLKGAHVDP